MPEGPEAYVTASYLKSLKGSHISYLDGEWALGLEKCENQEIIYVYSYGKKVIMTLEKGSLVFSLGMAGNICYYEKETKPKRICRLIISFTDGDEIHFNDARKFGKVEYLRLSPDTEPEDKRKKKRDLKIIKKRYGLNYCWLTDPPTLEKFRSLKGKRKLPIGNFLIDQGIVAGIGNYLRCDICYQAQVDISESVANLNDEDWERIYEAALDIIIDSALKGGYSIKDFIKPDGKEGGYIPIAYQNRRLERLRLGGRTVWA